MNRFHGNITLSLTISGLAIISSNYSQQALFAGF